jgi:hypothetical protein
MNVKSEELKTKLKLLEDNDREEEDKRLEGNEE